MSYGDSDKVATSIREETEKKRETDQETDKMCIFRDDRGREGGGGHMNACNVFIHA